MQSIKSMLSQRAVVLPAATALGVLGMTGVASAATYTVTTTNDSSDVGGCTSSLCSLRDAVQTADTAGGASTIDVPAGTYDLTLGNLVVNSGTNGAAITVNGAGSGSTIINSTDGDNIFYLDPSGGLSLAGLTLENGFAYEGGAIYSDGALTINPDVVFTGNAAEYGGAIYAYSDSGSSLSVNGATFNGDTGFKDGGAIADFSSGSASISHSDFVNNGSEAGGAIAGINGGPLNIDSSQFSDNTSYSEDYYGGAIAWASGSALAVTNTSFTENSAPEGGALYDYATSTSESTSLSGDQFTGNSAAIGGGAVYLDYGETSGGQFAADHTEFDDNNSDEYGGAIAWYGGSLESSGSSFIGNAATSEGGALYAENEPGLPLTLINATISKNSAFSGGGIYFDGSTPAALNNDTIAFNTAAPYGDGGGIYNAPDVTAATGYTAPPDAPASATGGVQNTIVANNVGSDCDTYNGPFTAAADPNGHNLDSDGTCFGGATPVGPGDKMAADALLGQPADNGGPVLTDAELAGSPAIDAGTNAGCPATDARGVSRPQGPACDIGAFEAAAANLALTKTGPSNTTTGSAFTYTLNVSNGGPGYSTGTTVTDQLPAGETLYGATPSQGSCTSAGSPAKVTCSLGNLDPGSGATVSLIVSDSRVGSVTNTATATNDQGSSVSASATTFVAASASAVSPPVAITGPSSKIKSTTAKITGTVKTSSSTSYFFQYGRNKKYGLASVLKRVSSTSNVSSSLGNLKPNTVYHYRLVATNSNTTSYGRDRTFKTKGHVYLGSLVLDSTTLHVRNGNVYAPFTCKSSKACVFRFSIVIRAHVAGTSQIATLVFTKTRNVIKTIGAHQTVTEVASVQPASLAVLQNSGRIQGKLSTRPRSNQRGIIDLVTLVSG